MAAKVAATETSDVHQLVVVGSGGVGKSCLTIRFLKDEFSNEYDPTIGKEYRLWLTLNAEENYRKSIMVDNVNATVNIIDTAGQQEYTALRDQHLKDGKGFLLVFAMNDRNTFEEVQQLREQIIKLKDTKRVPIVICGNKCDIPPEMMDIDKDAVSAWCQQLKMPYLETSAKENINVTDSFHDLVRECRKIKANPKTPASKKAKEPKSKCIIL